MTISVNSQFDIYEDYVAQLHIVDGDSHGGRILLSDNYAYDEGSTPEERKANALIRMERILAALNIGWKLAMIN